MPADPYTVAELDAAVARVDDLTDMTTDHYLTVEEEVRAALTAAAPLIAARVRAEAAERIARDLEHPTDLSDDRDSAAALRERRIAVAVARAHATTEEDHHG